MRNAFYRRLPLINRLALYPLSELEPFIQDITPEESIKQIGIDIHHVLSAYRNKETVLIENETFVIADLGHQDNHYKVLLNVINNWLEDGLQLAWAKSSLTTSKDNFLTYILGATLVAATHKAVDAQNYIDFLRKIKGYDLYRTTPDRYHITPRYSLLQQWLPDLVPAVELGNRVLPDIAEIAQQISDCHEPYDVFRPGIVGGQLIRAVGHPPSYRALIDAWLHNLTQRSTSVPDCTAWRIVFAELKDLPTTGITEKALSAANLVDPDAHLFSAFIFNTISYHQPESALKILVGINPGKTRNRLYHKTFRHTFRYISPTTVAPYCDPLAEIIFTNALNAYVCEQEEQVADNLTRADADWLEKSWIIEILLATRAQAKEIATDDTALHGIWQSLFTQEFKKACGVECRITPPTEVQPMDLHV